MAVLKIKDANGDWQNIVALKGDRGERGPEGPVGPAGGVSSVNGMTGDVTIPTVTLSSLGVTATATELNYVDGVTSNIQTQLNGKLSTTGTAAKATADASGNNIANTYAKLASPTFTGTPKAPTASAGTNTTQVATTAFVTTAVANKTSVSGNAGTATKLATPRTITLTGDATGSVSFDGSSDVSLDVSVSGGGVDTSTLVPKTGDRGNLAGYDQCYKVTANGTAEAITIDENSPDNITIIQKNDGSVALTFTTTNGVHYLKNILLSCTDKTKITTTFSGMSLVSNYMSNGYVNELTFVSNPMRLIVVCDDGATIVHEKPVIE